MTFFSGVIPPMVTPLLSHEQLDVESVDRLIPHLIDGGVNGIFVLGTTGEGPSLSYQIRYELVERTCEATAGKIPVLVGITDSCYSESLALAEHAQNSGAAAVVAAAPFYFQASTADLRSWFLRLADESPLPVMLYNMPSCVRATLDPDLIADLSEHQNIVGIKDSSGDLRYFEQICSSFRRPGRFCVFMGPEERLADAVAMGADGGVCGGANLLPHVYSTLYRVALDRRTDEIPALHRIIDSLFSEVYRDETRTMRLIPGLKHALSLTGICNDVTAPPFRGVSDLHAERIARAVPLLMSAAAQFTPVA